MDCIIGIGVALASMNPDRRPYEDSIAFSALPDAPTVAHRTRFTERLLRAARRRRRAAVARRADSR